MKFPENMISHRAESKFAQRQWENSLQNNPTPHWQGTNQESALILSYVTMISARYKSFYELTNDLALECFVTMFDNNNCTMRN